MKKIILTALTAAIILPASAQKKDQSGGYPITPVPFTSVKVEFPEYMKEADEQLQLDLFSVYMEEIQQEQKLLEQKIREQQKPVMAVSLVVGLMLSILLV